MQWSRNNKLAFLISGLVGASLGVVFGYLLHASGSGADGWMDVLLSGKNQVRSNSSLKPLSLLAIGCVPLAVFFQYLTHEYSQFFFLLIFFILVSAIILSVGFSLIQHKWAVNLATCFVSISFSLLLIEGLMRWNMGLLPEAIQNRFYNGNILTIQMEKLELFDHPPYVKFKPKV